MFKKFSVFVDKQLVFFYDLTRNLGGDARATGEEGGRKKAFLGDQT